MLIRKHPEGSFEIERRVIIHECNFLVSAASKFLLLALHSLCVFCGTQIARGADGRVLTTCKCALEISDIRVRALQMTFDVRLLFFFTKCHKQIVTEQLNFPGESPFPANFDGR